MKAIRRINNNIIICLDEKGNEIIARGKGIGFHEIPYEIALKDIERTYYNIDSSYFEMINEIPDEIIDISTRIIDYARENINSLDDSNIVFTLADHINFAIRRFKENVPLKLPVLYDIQYLMKEEYAAGLFGLQLIKEKTGIYLPKDEAAFIALHLHEVFSSRSGNYKDEDQMIEEITEIIEKQMQLHINKDHFNYSRFVSHMHYLLQRKTDSSDQNEEKNAIYEKLVEEYPEIYLTSEKIAEYLKENTYPQLSNNERMYLMLHISRLCSRENE